MRKRRKSISRQGALWNGGVFAFKLGIRAEQGARAAGFRGLCRISLTGYEDAGENQL